MGVEGPLISAIVIPTHDSAVAETYKILRRLRNGLVPLVDGDLDGNMKVEELRTVAEPPNLVLQWRDAWAIEDTIGWVLKASAGDALADLQTIGNSITHIPVREGPSRASSAKRAGVCSPMLSGTAPAAVKHGR